MIPIYNSEENDFRDFFEPPRPVKKVCSKCLKEFEVNSMWRHLCPIYEPDKVSICWDCFKKELKERELTKEEIKKVIDKRIHDEKFSSTFAPYSWWEGFTDKQVSQLLKEYEEFRQKEREEEEKRIREEYYSKAASIVMANGDDLTGIVATLLRKIDEKTFNRGEVVYK